MSKHSLGPWDNLGPYEVHSDDGTLVCTISGWQNREKALANAKLISACPDFLEALESIREMAATRKDDGFYFEIADEALAKWEGKK